jgi:single-stranded DNA-binding protein
MNVTILTGEVTKPPEFRKTSTGTEVCYATLLVRSMYFSLVAFGHLAHILKTATQGQTVTVSGGLTSNEWVAGNGEKRQKIQLTVKTIGFEDTPHDSPHTAEVRQ